MFRSLSRPIKKMSVSGAPAFNRIRPVYGTMAITQRDTTDPSPNVIAVLAHPGGTDTLNPPAAPVTAGPGPFGGFYKVPAFLAEGALKEITFASNELTLPNDGVYHIVAYVESRFNLNNATMAFVFGIERAGQISFSQRPTANTQVNLGKPRNTSGNGQLSGLAGDKISLWAAVDKVGNITVGNANVTIAMIEDTTP